MLLHISKHLRRLHKAPILIPKISPAMTRTITDNKSIRKSSQENWSEIYRLPLIRLAAGFNRLKIYQALVTMFGMPLILSLESAGHLDPGFAAIFAGIGFTGVITLTLCSWPVRNLIGFIYINDRQDRIRIAYVDFWGKRRETELNIDDILSPWELPHRNINLYHPVTTQTDQSKCYKIIHRYGVVRDPEQYVKIFGEDH